MKKIKYCFPWVALFLLASTFFGNAARATDPLCVECVRIYSKPEYVGTVTKHPRGVHNLAVPTAIGSFTVNPPVSVLFYNGKNGTGRYYGPFKGLYKETSGTPGDWFSIETKVSSVRVFDSSKRTAAIKAGWRMRKEGNIVHGSGSYFLSDKRKTMVFRYIKTEKEAWAKVIELAGEDWSNPPIMWQLAHPWEPGPVKSSGASGLPETRKGRWKGSPGFLVVHFKEFIDETPDLDVFGIKDKWTADSRYCYTAELERYAKERHAHPEGNPLYFLADAEPVVSSKKPIRAKCREGALPLSSSKAAKWRMRTTGNIVHGPGSYYTSEKDVTLEFKGIKTEAAARKKIEELTGKNPSNPPVMWQLSNFTDKRDGHLIVHLKSLCPSG